jgi:DNA-binding SARP family transcriptional activator
METAVAFFIAVQVLAVTLYVGLAAYVAAQRTLRLSEFPFVALCLVQAVDASASAFLNTAGAPADLANMLRLRTATAILTAVLVLHVTVSTLRGRPRKLGMTVVVAAYFAGLTGILLSGLTNPTVPRTIGDAVADLRSPQAALSPAGYALVIFCVAVNLTAMSSLLTVALSRSFSPRRRSEARHILGPALLLTFAFLLGSTVLGLPLGSVPALNLGVETLQRLLCLGAGLLLANGVLRFGSPAGQPVHYGLSPMVIGISMAIVVDVVPLLIGGRHTPESYLTPPLLTGLLGGILLARAESFQLAGRWLGRLPPQETPFAQNLRVAWRSLAAHDVEGLSLEGLARGLQSQIAAAYVEILERSAHPEGTDGLVFAGFEGAPILRLPSDDLDWPITESATRIRAEGFPGPASLILPVLKESEVVGTLVIGEPERAGVYGRSDVMHAEMLADFLSAVCSAKVPLVRRATSGAARAHPRPAAPPPTALAIRAFGRLEVIAPRNPLARTPTMPLRARQLLAYLLTSHPSPVAAETLMEHLWPEAPPETAANNLYVAVYGLRRALEPGLPRGEASRYIVREGDSYSLQLDDTIRVDIREFEALYRQGQRLMRANHTGEALAEFLKALADYRGPYLEEVALEQSPEVEAVRHRLRRFCAEMARLAVRRLVEQGQAHEAVELLLPLRQADPWDETFVELLAEAEASLKPDHPRPATAVA